MGVPKHVAIIPDGNRRWAKKYGLASIEGHKKGIQVMFDLAKKAKELGISVLTIWAFSTENWSRNEQEIRGLMGLFEAFLKLNMNKILAEEARVIHIGRKDRLSAGFRNMIRALEEKTKRNDAYFFVLALDYGGRDEVLRVVQQMSLKFNPPAGEKNLTEQEFENFLDTKDILYPNPDLVIRTSGERRTSGFMIWQAAYAEWEFVEEYFPDFTAERFEQCIRDFEIRKRRFGK